MGSIGSTLLTLALATTPLQAQQAVVAPGASEGTLFTMALPRQGTPEDSLYRQAREALNRGEYRRAAELFRTFDQRHPRSRYAPAAMYWQAFALYRVGAEAELRQALQVLDRQRELYPQAAADADVSALLTRLAGALAARGDADAARRLREGIAAGEPSCDREEMAVRAEALSALVQADPTAATAVIRRVLQRTDSCSVPLRRRAVYLMTREQVGTGLADLLTVARNDPDLSVRSDAVSRIAQQPGEEPVRALEQILNAAIEERLQRAVLSALRRSEHAAAARVVRQAIERVDLPESVRAEAIRSLARRSGLTTPSAVAEVLSTTRVQAVRPTGAVYVDRGILRAGDAGLSEEDATYLRGLFARSTSRAMKMTIVETLAAAGGAANDQWLMALARNPNEEVRYRSAALHRLRRSEVSIDELGRLYDQLSERQLRSTLIVILGMREEDAATDRLIAIARSGTDPELRRAAINALTRKKDPRTTRLLLELVER